MPVKYRYIFFDLDRTLWDYDANSRRSLELLYEQYGLREYFPTPEDFIDRYDRNNSLLWEEYRNGRIFKEELRSKRFRITFEERGLIDESLAGKVGEHYMQITPGMNLLFPNTVETLEYLVENNYTLFILTNGFISTQEMKIRNSGIESYFRRMFSSEEIGINKPRQEIFHWAVTSLNAPKQQCLMIGDDPGVDIEGAMAYGIDAVLFDPEGIHPTSGRYRSIRDLAELRAFL